MTFETHPLQPFLPKNGRILFLGSFPPPKSRWSMEFFYPNWINDFWRIQGLIHYNDKAFFETKGANSFDKDRIIEFAESLGLAFYDTARKVRRLKDNASDNFLEIVEPTDVGALLQVMPQCSMIVTTGGKASEELQKQLSEAVGMPEGLLIEMPKIGDFIVIKKNKNVSSSNSSTTSIFTHQDTIQWWRMPSSSRAYPLALPQKAEYYKRLFED